MTQKTKLVRTRKSSPAIVPIVPQPRPTYREKTNNILSRPAGGPAAVTEIKSTKKNNFTWGYFNKKSWKSLRDFVHWTFIGTIILYVFMKCIGVMQSNPEVASHVLIYTMLISAPIVFGRIARYVWYNYGTHIGFRIETWKNAYLQSKKKDEGN